MLLNSLYKIIMTRFGCSIELVSIQGEHFLNEVIKKLTSLHLILLKMSTVYYLQANGKILRRILSKSSSNQDKKLDSALWDFL